MVPLPTNFKQILLHKGTLFCANIVAGTTSVSQRNKVLEPHKLQLPATNISLKTAQLDTEIYTLTLAGQANLPT